MNHNFVSIFWKLFWPVGYLICKILFRLKVYGLENLQSIQSPVIFYSNHNSYWDPIFISVALPSYRSKLLPIHWLAKHEVFNSCLGLVGLIVKAFGVLQISNGKTNKQAIKDALSILANGHSLGIFPEGGRSPSGRIQPFSNGLMYLAKKANIPVVPVQILGAHKISFTKLILGKIRIKVIFKEVFLPEEILYLWGLKASSSNNILAHKLET